MRVQPFVTFRVMDEHGGVLHPSLEPDVSQDDAVRMYKTMIQLNVMDSILYEAQRQGRLSFYMTNYGTIPLIDMWKLWHHGSNYL